MNILKFVGGSMFTNLLAFLYRTAARVYEIVLKFSYGETVLAGTSCTTVDGIKECTSPVSGLITTLYALIGLFMLFRITVSFLNYLIDPDKMSDKQVGGAKLLGRVVVSIVLFLSLNSIIFPFLYKLQGALLDTEGILNKIFDNKKYDEALYMLTDDVNAAADTQTLAEYLQNNPNVTEEEAKAYVLAKIENFVASNSNASGEKFPSNFKLQECTTGQVGGGCYHYNLKYVDGVCSNGASSCIQSIAVSMKNEGMSGCNGFGNMCIFGNNMFVEKNSSGFAWPKVDVQTTTYYPNAQPVTTTTSQSVPIYTQSKKNTVEFDIDIIQITAPEAKAAKTCYYTYYGPYSVQGTSGEAYASKFMDVPIPIEVTYYPKSTDNSSIIYKNRTASSKASGWYFSSSKYIDIGSYRYYFGPSNNGLNTLNENSGCPTTISNVMCTINENLASISGDAWTNEDVVNRVLGSMSCKALGKVQIDNNSLGSTAVGLKNGSLSKEETIKATMKDMGENIDNPLQIPEEFQYSRQIDEESLAFVMSILSSFVEPQDAFLNEKGEMGTAFLNDVNYTNMVANKVEDGEITIDMFMALIVGIALIAYLFVICIEVVVRNLKLMFLEVISPIAVMSYMDPSDKVFNSWVKQYTGTFVSLFVQLLVLRAGIYFINLLKVGLSGFSLILLYAGAFIFIKAAPKMISSIFNIDAMGGTFKESMNLAKAGLFGAIGGAIGAGAATATGIKAWNASKGQGRGNRFAAAGSALATGLSSTARGIGSGFSGKLGNTLAGAKYASQTNAKRAGLYESGYDAGSVMWSDFTKGLYDPNKKDEQIEAAYDDVLAKRKVMDDRIAEEVVKKGKGGYRITGQTGDAAIANGLSVQQLENVINSGKFNGRELTENEKSALGAISGDQKNAAAAHYMKQVAADPKIDEDLSRAMKYYDATIERYSKALGKKVGSSSDPEYTYDFTSFVSTKAVVAASGSAVDVGKVYKRTKDEAESAKNKFSGSDTRHNHIKLSKDK